MRTVLIILISNISEMKSNRPDQHLLEIEEAQNKTTKYLNKSIDFNSIDILMTYYRSHILSTL